MSVAPDPLQRSISSTPHHPQIPPTNRPGYRPTAAPTTSEKDSFLDATDPLTLLPNKLKTFLFHNIFYLPFAHEKDPLLVCSRGAQIPIVQNPLLFLPLSQYIFRRNRLRNCRLSSYLERTSTRGKYRFFARGLRRRVGRPALSDSITRSRKPYSNQNGRGFALFARYTCKGLLRKIEILLTRCMFAYLYEDPRTSRKIGTLTNLNIYSITYGLFYAAHSYIRGKISTE